MGKGDKIMKALFRFVAITVVLFLSAVPALADSWNVGNGISYTLSNTVATPYGTGGLFTLTNDNTGAVSPSFCLELDEYIYNTDVIGSITTYAVNGGRNVTGVGSDPISSATDWLYAQFSTGNALYQNARALQIAFWLLEEEMTAAEASSWATTYSWGTALTTANSYIADATPNMGSYGTMVLNLQDAAGNPHQSQLYRPVPVPPAIWLLGSGLIGLLTVRRRKIRN